MPDTPAARMARIEALREDAIARQVKAAPKYLPKETTDDR